MQVAGEHQIDSRVGELMQRSGCAPEDSRSPTLGRRYQMVMEDCDLEDRSPRVCEALDGSVQLATQDAATGQGEVESRVDADQSHLLILEPGFELGREVPPVRAERPPEALPEPVQGNVMVAGYDQRRGLDLIDESSRLAELAGLGALGEIAG